MALLHLEIVTPDQIVLDTYVDYVGAPGVDGEFGVLAGHIPLLTALQIGLLYYRIDGKETQVFISGGFAEVAENKISILAQSAEIADNIDVKRAEAALKRAEERLLPLHKNEVDHMRAELALKRAIVRLGLTKRI